ncbi:MAG TPA: aldehyde dehydrogenase family protein [Desulfobacteraceae bacterium]|nr:aldehyde dehydrogenase family protein [Desulfobacteraceae bacterium]
MEQIPEFVKKQKEFFKTDTTKDISFRKENLKKLRKLILQNQEKIEEALWKDLHKSEYEVWSTEIGLVLKEIRVLLANLKKWSRKKTVRTPLLLFRSKSCILPEPYGQVLILAPWNYPFQLLFAPLAGAMAAGNCVFLRPSSNTPATAKLMEEMISENFPPEYISIINGSRESAQALLNEKFDYIFFTGSPYVGRKVMEAASKHLTPVSLELGGKSPCIVTKDANLDLAARRIVWGKFLHAGQTCVTPDYLLVDHEVKDRLIEKLLLYVNKFFGPNPMESNDFVRIVNKANVIRLEELMKAGTIITGGTTDPENCYVAPTIITDIKPEDPIMKEEIFGPLLPVMEYQALAEAIEFINSRPDPLALYIFSEKKSLQMKVLKETQSGTVAINDTVFQFVNRYLPFGGRGESGMGKYHGKSSFETFTHYRSILNKKNKTDFPVRYPKYNAKKLKLLKLFLR